MRFCILFFCCILLSVLFTKFFQFELLESLGVERSQMGVVLGGNTAPISDRSTEGALTQPKLEKFCDQSAGILLSQTPGTSGGIHLLNDSAFTLTAVVQAADGTFLGQAVFSPGQQSDFVNNFGPTGIETPSYYNIPLTPYTVFWKCPNGGFYSVCKQVSPGALVTANTCPGVYFCQPKKPKNKDKDKGEEDFAPEWERPQNQNK